MFRLFTMMFYACLRLLERKIKKKRKKNTNDYNMWLWRKYTLRGREITDLVKDSTLTDELLTSLGVNGNCETDVR